ncbi:hypothetical protein A8C46_08500 [Ligilactobacillus salivarius]|uniref:hypothetical protein n=1 Tax=Ligilactobacillus salivarius TaxID=1624 RepID=UPI000A2D9005|nr:hypothetical protein [Ligilactobacillus salivarius]OTF89029.1 hypothetical protein A8C38_01505 [Ligilactobacillus salivarius]PAY42538.1 hypothetical protein A8C39_08390 [Ligilactobacillus salivarius]PAY48769.1 hypothetical protein A8C42_07855 [Ligilactobacillus salivarius]PAY52651.1 hypothetical protein A8C41_08930 [Ligilactobacillus salivarius]PAY56613.1 hypothetical protein A8C46_08500 [Ligilactobacillus salivarius]
MKRYLYDAETKRFTGTVDSDSDETLENSTEISPFDADGQARIGTWFDVDSQTWKVPTTESTQDQRLFMNLSQNVATLQSMVMMQNQQLAQLMTKEAN